jgi:DNA-binding transcriptional LysR family regulator
MEMRHLRYFIASAEEGSFLNAAKRLRVAQPSLSRQIRDLEREVGVLLFERLPRGVRLTGSGEAFFREARTTLECAARAVAVARSDGKADRLLRVAHGTLLYYATTLSKILAAFRHAHPQAHISILRLNETRQRAALRERRIDVAVTFIATPAIEGFGTHHLVDAAITGVVLPVVHMLAEQQVVSLAHLKDLTWLRVPRQASPELYRSLKASLLSRGLTPGRERSRPRDPEVAAMHVAAEDAWMLASAEIGRVYTQTNPAVVYRPFVEQPIPCWLAMLSSLDGRSSTVDQFIATAGIGG